MRSGLTESDGVGENKNGESGVNSGEERSVFGFHQGFTEGFGHRI